MISNDGDEIYYTQSNFDHSIQLIMVFEQLDADWKKPLIASFSGDYNDIEPFLSPDGSKVFFSSDRPIDSDDTTNDYDIWVCIRGNEAWGDPKPLPEIINTKFNEFYPAVSANENLYYTSTNPNGVGLEDIFNSVYLDGRYTDPVPVDATINSNTIEFNAYISPSEDLLIFSSYGREDDLCAGDLYYKTKNSGGNWNEAIHLEAPINSSGLDYCPFLDVPRSMLYLKSNGHSSRKGQYNAR